MVSVVTFHSYINYKMCSNHVCHLCQHLHPVHFFSPTQTTSTTLFFPLANRSKLSRNFRWCKLRAEYAIFWRFEQYVWQLIVRICSASNCDKQSLNGDVSNRASPNRHQHWTTQYRQTLTRLWNPLVSQMCVESTNLPRLETCNNETLFVPC